jgi:hypothetical protein
LTPFLPRPRPLNQQEVPTANNSRWKHQSQIEQFPRAIATAAARTNKRLGSPREWPPQESKNKKNKLKTEQ